MKASTLRKPFTTALLIAAALSLPAIGPTRAAKPGGSGGAVPPGRISFVSSSQNWTMNADGSDKRLAPHQSGEFSHLSYQVHQGHRWFLEFRDSPNHAQRYALFAVRDDGDPDFTVLLVDDPDLEFLAVRWGKDDSFVSFSGADMMDSLGTQIWAANIAFDETTGLPALTAAPVSIVAQPFENGIVRGFDFSPQGDEVVYQLGDGSGAGLLVTDLLAGVTDVLVGPGGNARPVWSPDGTAIAFDVTDVGICVIRPDGTGLSAVTKTSWGDHMGDWSPDSQHIAFTRFFRKSGPGGTTYYWDVMRVPASGGSPVNLTKDIDSATALYWR
jgi:WD40-like Beta Propeller Repeat